jgi:type I restriction-modification system DNA methylase subunit
VRRNAKRLKSVRESELLSQEYQDSEKFEMEISGLEKNVKKSLFKKSQKLIDRFLFIFFAEDRGLLPPNSIHKIIADWNKLKDLDAEMPLYERFKLYFGYLDTGRKGTDSRAEIFAYNGGLFKPDNILDLLEVDDKLLYKHTAKLATYDFESQVDVNILGHIFENSLNEIESINAEIEGGEFDKQTSKRKKDGVFYTPKYITKYIVENTVGKLCDEKKNELNFHEEDYFEVKKGAHTKTKKKLLQTLDIYRAWLLQLTICDPACGSGAFLNQALDFLIKEHRYIDELKAKVLGGALVFSDIENTILENNIYGVDINEESVEIAKLSLWLRTAQPRRKLNDLSKNIKCGDSLINDKKIVDEKAFKWENEFSEVFTNGGFDLIIGNPPYVRQELINPLVKTWLAGNYVVGNGTADLYVYFYERSLEILKENGMLGLITPNKFFKTKYGSNLREYLKRFRIIELIDFFELKVFEDASTDSQITIIQKSKPAGTLIYSPIIDIKEFRNENKLEKVIDIKSLKKSAYIFIEKPVQEIIDKIISNSRTLKDYTSNGIEYGIKTGFNEAFIINQFEKESICKEDKNSERIMKPYLRPTAIGRWSAKYNYEYLIATTPSKKIEIENYPGLKSHFLKYGIKRLKQDGEKGSRKKTSNKWFETSDSVSYIKKFEEKKIIYIRTAVNHNFYFDEEGFHVNDSCYIISPADKFLSAYLNSSIFSFYKKIFFVAYGNAESSGRVKLDYNKMIDVPVPNINPELKQVFDLLVDDLKIKSTQFDSLLSKYENFYSNKYYLNKVPRKLQNWHNLTFSEFIKELKKVIKKSNSERAKVGLEYESELTKKDEFEWMELFEENKKKAQELQTQISQIEKEIDQMVYKLYGLTEKEIALVGAS